MEEEPIIEPWWKGPLKYVLGLFLIILMVAWYFPSRAITIDPEPTRIPTIAEVLPSGINSEHSPIEVRSRQDFTRFVIPSDPLIKQTADNIVTTSCSGNRVCYAKAIYYFVRDNFQYVSDPTAYEYVKTAHESLSTTGGDCEDGSILAANLLQAVGIRTRFVFIPGHVYLQAYLPEATRRYKSEDKDWVSMELTCDTCRFGELPYSDLVDNKEFIE